jgi:hypothetical protein
MDVAQAQQAYLLALRAAANLLRFHRERGTASPALARLLELYNRFDEGLDLDDLRTARTLIGAASA